MPNAKCERARQQEQKTLAHVRLKSDPLCSSHLVEGTESEKEQTFTKQAPVETSAKDPYNLK